MKKTTLLTAIALCSSGFVFGQAVQANQNQKKKPENPIKESFATPAEKEAYVNANKEKSYQLFTKHNDTSTEQERAAIRDEERKRLNPKEGRKEEAEIIEE